MLDLIFSVENAFESRAAAFLGLRPTFDASIKGRSRICVLIAGSIEELHDFRFGIVHAAKVAIHL